MSLRGVVRSLPLAALALGVVAGARAQEPIGAVDVQVTVDRTGTARVEERYVVTPGPRTLELRALLRPCAAIGEVRIERDGVETALVRERRGPWLVHRDTSVAPGADTLRLSVRYEVRTVGTDADVPLLHLTEPIPQRDGEREGTVHLVVRFADEGGSVLFPHVARASATEWSARYVAIPSFVQVARPDATGGTSTDCASLDAAPGSDGGLTWRFLLLVGIMVAWVPTYLAWARRTAEDGA